MHLGGNERCDPLLPNLSFVDDLILTGFYDQLRYFADYGPIFQRITVCYKGKEEAIVKIRGPSQDLQDS